jgi:hypothetical protein
MNKIFGGELVVPAVDACPNASFMLDGIEGIKAILSTRIKITIKLKENTLMFILMTIVTIVGIKGLKVFYLVFNDTQLITKIDFITA